jgi:hypothetical protein
MMIDILVLAVYVEFQEMNVLYSELLFIIIYFEHFHELSLRPKPSCRHEYVRTRHHISASNCVGIFLSSFVILSYIIAVMQY